MFVYKLFCRTLNDSINAFFVLTTKGRINLGMNASLTVKNMNISFFDCYWNSSTIINNNGTFINFIVNNVF